MQCDNVRYLVFGTSGELLKDNIVSLLDEKITIGFEFDVVLEINEMQLRLGSGSLYFPLGCAYIKHIDIGGQNIALSIIFINGKHYSAIVYHECFESLNMQLFNEWKDFFLGKKPRCNCKGRYEKVLIPYANKVMQSMAKYFKLEDCYTDGEIDEDGVICFGFKNKEVRNADKI